MTYFVRLGKESNDTAPSNPLTTSCEKGTVPHRSRVMTLWKMRSYFKGRRELSCLGMPDGGGRRAEVERGVLISLFKEIIIYNMSEP